MPLTSGWAPSLGLVAAGRPPPGSAAGSAFATWRAERQASGSGTAVVGLA